MLSREGDGRGQFSKSDIDGEGYANVRLLPAQSRRYLEQLGVEPDSEPEGEAENGERM
jgi:hypothetical protein